MCVSEELKSQGLEPCWDEEKAVVSVFEYVCFMLNSHACVCMVLQRHRKSFLLVKRRLQ